MRKQVDQLEAEGFVVDGTKEPVLNNQLILVTRKDSATKVKNLNQAENIALAGGSVPAGKYTRQALINLGIVDEKEPAEITAEEVSKAFNGVEISEQDNVSKVLSAVLEGSCEVGTVYYSDIYGHEDDLDILEIISYDLSGNIIYPIAGIVNDEASENEIKNAEKFREFILSDNAKKVFKKYNSTTNIV